ncbi:MAG: DNA primase [Actinomycetota bacterium]|nr:DNA primase [Actinomycetota bacterium]
MAIAHSDVALVLERLDIVALVGEYVTLRRAGNRFSGLCPFHNESTPSFTVNPALGVYHCFGCGASGDSISFIRAIEHLDFAESVQLLADRAGVSLTQESEEDARRYRESKRIAKVLNDALDFYRKNLYDGADSKLALDYLANRGIDTGLQESFQIGLAPRSSTALPKILNLPNALFQSCGLGYVDSTGQQRDMFAGRLIFPIFDDKGQVVAFGGRVLPGIEIRDSEGAKYKNSTETKYYRKRRTLYGLNLAKSEIVRNQLAIICEGYTDVIAFHKVGLPLAIATCGTALTEEHLDRLKNYSRNIVLAFDGDKAGQSATERIYEWEKKFSLAVKVAKFPPGEDPASLSLNAPEELKRAIEEAKPFLSFRLERHLEASDLSSIEGRLLASTKAVEIIAEHPNAIVRGNYLMEISEACDVDIHELERRLERTRRALRTKGDDTAKARRRPTESVGDEAPIDNSEEPDDRSLYSVRELTSGEYRPYNIALWHLLHNCDEVIDYMPSFLFTHPVHIELHNFAAKNREVDAQRANQSQLTPSARALMAAVSQLDGDHDVVDVIARLLELHSERTIEALLRSIRGGEGRHLGEEEAMSVTQAISYLRKTIGDLRDSRTMDGAVRELLTYFA